MKNKLPKLTLVLAALLLMGCASHEAPIARAAPVTAGPHEQTMRAAVASLCRRDVVLLGENGFHGDGETAAFKAQLVERLVRSCGFRAVFFEAGHYDFLAFQRHLRDGGEATSAMLASAIGYVWNQDREVAPLIEFLFAQARSGRVMVGGLDDQLGSRGAFYSLEQLPVELASYLEEPLRQECAARIRQRIWSDYSEDAPYAPPLRQKLVDCLAAVRTSVGGRSGQDASRADVLQMIDNMERLLDRDFQEPAERNAQRDRSMYLNLRWLQRRLPRGARTIVWSSNVHVAKDGTAIPALAGRGNLGSHVHEEFGRRAYSLAFTAGSGSFRWGMTSTRQVPEAQPGSLEARALAVAPAASVFLGQSALREFGTVAGSALDDHQPVSMTWANVYDGVVVFRTERPPTRLQN